MSGKNHTTKVNKVQFREDMPREQYVDFFVHMTVGVVAEQQRQMSMMFDTSFDLPGLLGHLLVCSECGKELVEAVRKMRANFLTSMEVRGDNVITLRR